MVSRWYSIEFLFSPPLCVVVLLRLFGTQYIFFGIDSTTFPMHWNPQNYSLTFRAFAVTTHISHFQLNELRFLVIVSNFFTMHTNWISVLLKSLASLVAKSIIGFSTLQVQVNCVNHFFFLLFWFDIDRLWTTAASCQIIIINPHTHSQTQCVASGSCCFGLNSALLWLYAMFLCRVILMLFTHWFLSQLRKSWQKR